MNNRGADAIASSVQKTNRWLKELSLELRGADRHRAYAVLRAVLHALRDCLPVDENAKLSAQLPMLVRGIYFDGWRPRAKPLRLTKKTFYDVIWEQLRGHQGLDAPLAVRAVFNLLGRHISRGEIDGVRAILPREVRSLWDAVEVEEEERELHLEERQQEDLPKRSPQWTPSRGAAAGRPWRPSDSYPGGRPYGSH